MHVVHHILASDVALKCCGYCGFEFKTVLVSPKNRGRARSLTQPDQAGTESCARRCFRVGNAASHTWDNQKRVNRTNYPASCPECYGVVWKYSM
jgi:hypothetical protein